MRDFREPALQEIMAHRFHWDFFGPLAEKTAAHFEHHLEEFLGRSNITAVALGCEHQAGGSSVFCEVPEEFEQGLVSALRPRRVVETGDERASR